MSQPPDYDRQTDFADWSAGHPTTPHDGANLDREFNAAKATLDVVLTNLALLQRDDGALRNLLVTPDSLSATVRALMVADWSPEGDWVTATAYAVKDVVATGGNSYICAVAHTSGTFATDLAAGKWMLLSVNSAEGLTVDGATLGVSADNYQDAMAEFVAQVRHELERVYRIARNNAAAASVPASDSVAGIVQLATTAETTTGTEAAKAVTPDGLHDMTSLAGAAWFLDEDNMASDSATKTISQQSAKAYMDAAIAAITHDFEFVSSTAITAAALLTVNNLAAGYDYMIALEGFAPTTNTNNLFMRVAEDTVPTIQSDGADYMWSATLGATDANDSSDSEMQLSGTTLGNTAAYRNTLLITAIAPNESGESKDFVWHGFGITSGSTVGFMCGGGAYIGSTNPVQAVQFGWSTNYGTDTFKAQGRITVWRRKRS